MAVGKVFNAITENVSSELLYYTKCHIICIYNKPPKFNKFALITANMLVTKYPCYYIPICNIMLKTAKMKEKLVIVICFIGSLICYI